MFRFGYLISVISKIFYRKRILVLLKTINRIHLLYVSNLKGRIPDNLLRCLVLAEDHRFYKHHGVDLMAIIGAIIWNLRKKHIRGASTIEQQFVRVVTGRYELTLNRKIKEIFLASQLPKYFEKYDIAGMYLMIGYYGWKMNGLENACKRLDYDIKNLRVRESASIVARLKYPEPRVLFGKRKAQIISRTNKILKRFYEQL